jgi:hypothetical protein
MTETSLASGSSTILATSLISDGHTDYTLRQIEVFLPPKKQGKILICAPQQIDRRFTWRHFNWMMMWFIQRIQRIQKKEALLSPCLGSIKTQRLTQALGVHQERRPSLCLSHMTQHVQNLRIKAYRALIYRALILRLHLYIRL